MTIAFTDLQNEDNPRSGMLFDDPLRLRTLLAELASRREAGACQFTHDNGSGLIVGVSPSLGFVQYTTGDAMPPYLMATAASAVSARQDMEFAIADTMTPIAGKYLIPIELIAKVVEDFLVTGQRSAAVSWVEFE